MDEQKNYYIELKFNVMGTKAAVERLHKMLLAVAHYVDPDGSTITILDEAAIAKRMEREYIDG